MASPSTGFYDVSVNQDPVLDAMIHGYYWVLDQSRSIDYSVSQGPYGEYWYEPAEVRSHMRLAMDMYASYLDVSFNDLGFYSGGYYQAPYEAYLAGSEINLSLVSRPDLLDSSTGAVGLFPAPELWDSWLYPGAHGDIYLNVDSIANDLPSYEPGSLGWSILIHEIGHVLGLKHPHDDGATSSSTFADIGLSNLDIDWATIMSYNDSSWSYTDGHPVSPMFLDVLALQALYGVNNATNAGNTVHRLQDFYGSYYSLWDASGVDVLDLSGVAQGWHIELPNEILISSVSTKTGLAAPINDFTQAENRFEGVWSYTPNTLVWLLGDYEKVYGSDYSDIFEGNSLNNYFDGGLGNDECLFIGGVDEYDFQCVGGLENEIIIYDKVNGRDGVDTLINVEHFIFNGASYSFQTLQELSAPSIQEVKISASALGQLRTGDALVVTLDFNTPVFIEDWPYVVLDIEGVQKKAIYFSGAGTQSISFQYEIENGLSFDHAVDVTLQGTLLGGGLVDQYGNAANLTSLSSELTNILISNQFVGGHIDDVILGSYGDDDIYGYTGDDRLLGLEGDDYLNGASGNDLLDGGSGNDLIESGVGADWLLGGEDNDELVLDGDSYWGAGFFSVNTSLFSLAECSESLFSLQGLKKLEQVVDGGSGSDVMRLTGESDFFALHDALSNFYSNPELLLAEDSYGHQAVARLVSIEEIFAGAGNDLIDMTSVDYAYLGGISIYGEEGDDTLWGSTYNDKLFGGIGNDTLFGSQGNDDLWGGQGHDAFEFSVGAGADVIHDFDIASDKLIFYSVQSWVDDVFHGGFDRMEINSGVITWNDVSVDLMDSGLSDLTQIDVDIVYI